MTMQQCVNCKNFKRPNDFVKPDGKLMKCCCECRNSNGVRSRDGRRRAAQSQKSNPKPVRPPIPDRIVDFNSMPAPRRLTVFRVC